jgi:rRNA-processing protein FCF1
LNTIVLDSGAIIALERRMRRMVALLERARTNDWTILIPSAVIGEVWRGPKTDPTIARLFNAVNGFPVLDRACALRVGELLALAGLSGGSHVVDGSVVDTAMRLRPCLIATSDPVDIQRLIAASQVHGRIEIYVV